MNKSLIVGGVIVFLVLLAILYPTISDMRPTIYDYTKWLADTFGLLFGYFGLIVGLGLVQRSGGKMKSGLTAFNVGMFIMGSSFFFGPIINHYRIIDKDLVEGIHGIGMLGGMVGYLIAMHWFLSIIGGNRVSKREMVWNILIFLIFISLYIPTTGVHRTLGNNIKYWTELTGFGLGGVMVLMVFRAKRFLGGSYRNAVYSMLVSMIVMSLSYPFGPISQPNHFWTGAQGGSIHHGIMALAIILFLWTAVSLQRLNVYSLNREPSRALAQ